jgi:hypothetical protein
MKTERNVQESFEELYTKISELQDEKDSLTLQLPINRFVVAFEDISTTIDGTKVNKPEHCTFPCICICKTDLGEAIEDNVCDTATCYDLELEDNMRIVDENLDHVFIEGTYTKAVPVFLKKEENLLYISKSSTFTSDEIDEYATHFTSMLATFELVKNSEADCISKIDFSPFVNLYYGIHISPEKSELINMYNNEVIYSTDVSYEINYQDQHLPEFWIYPDEGGGTNVFLYMTRYLGNEDIEVNRIEPELYSLDGEIYVTINDGVESNFPECSDSLVSF